MRRITSRGFSVIEIVIVLVVIVIIAGLGYAFFTKKDQPLANNSAEDTSQAASSESTPGITVIDSSDDLDKAAKELDQLDIDDTSDDASLSSSMSNL